VAYTAGPRGEGSYRTAIATTPKQFVDGRDRGYRSAVYTAAWTKAFARS
jgi:hypothetical protein